MTVDDEQQIAPDREFETIDLNINIGPQHPATHGVFRMVLVIDGELVVDMVPHIGYMHRGAEKLSENMDYRQANRLPRSYRISGPVQRRAVLRAGS